MDKILKKPGDKFEFIRDQSFKPSTDDTKRKGIPHTFFFDTEQNTYKEVFKKYVDEPEYISKPKIITTYKSGKKKSLLFPKYYSEKMGSTANTMYYILQQDSDNKDKLMFFLDSKLMHFLLKITQYSESPNHINEIKILNMISKPTGKIESDADVYEYFGLSKAEIDIIEYEISSVVEDDAVAKPKKVAKTRKPPKKAAKGGKLNKTKKFYFF